MTKAPVDPSAPGRKSGAVLMTFVVEKTKKLIVDGVLELHPLANPQALAEDILEFLYARDPQPNAADFIEWLLERGDIEEVYGEDEELYGLFVPATK